MMRKDNKTTTAAAAAAAANDNSKENAEVDDTAGFYWAAPDDDDDDNDNNNNSTAEAQQQQQQQQEEIKVKKGYSWQQLQALEANRRDILKRTELPFWKILSYWDGTCLGILSRDELLWATCAIYTFIRMQVRFYPAGGLPAYVSNIGGSSSNIDILGGFLSFLLVFFLNQANNRFNEMYKQSTECTRRIYDVAGLVATTMPAAHALRLVRYLNAAHVVGYVGLSHTYTKHAFFDPLNKSLRLLQEDELKYMEQCDMDHKSDCFREITTWCLMEVRTAEAANLIDARLAGMLREKICNFRAALDSMFDYVDQSVHFFYIHFLSLLTAIYLPIFAISSAYSAGTGEETHWSTDILCGIIVMLQAIFVIGLRLLGQKMLDAYGDDLEDLSVLHYVREAWKTSNRMLASHFPAPVSSQTEEDLTKQATSLGYPWDKSQRQHPAPLNVTASSTSMV